MYIRMNVKETGSRSIITGMKDEKSRGDASSLKTKKNDPVFTCT